METNLAGSAIVAADPLLPEAAAWVEQLRAQGEDIVLYPISRLQRQFRIGYSRTCGLVEALALDQWWRIEFAEDGPRYRVYAPTSKDHTEDHLDRDS